MKDIFYFDNAATTFPKPDDVYKFMDSFYRTNGVNVGRGQYNLAAKASFLVEETRRLLQKIFNCENKKVVFTSSATEAINISLQGLIKEKNLNIYISPFEHNSVTRTLYYLKEIYELNIYELKVSKNNFTYDISMIKKEFEENKPDLVIMSSVSNVCGLIAPTKEIFSLSKEYGSINIVDTCQSAGLIDMDLGSDIYDIGIFAGHKTLYGPLGIAGMIIKNELRIDSLIFGGTGVESANQNMPMTIPEKYEAGSLNILSISGLNRALKWIYEIGLENLKLKEKINLEKLLNLLKEYENLKIVGFKDIENNIGVISCIFDTYSSDEIGQVLNRFNIGTRVGLHCSPLAHKFLGTFPSGTVRFSVGYFNDDEDFCELKKALDYIKENS